MARPHPVLVELAAGRAPGPFPDADDGLLASAADHGMSGLLWTWVREHAPHYSARTELARFDAAVRHRHGRLWSALTRVQDELGAIGVEVAAVKGVTAEARWYGRTGERPCSDVDVLVDPGATGRVGEILAVLAPGHPLGADADALVRADVLQSVGARVDGVSVDIHVDLFKVGFPVRRPDLVWERTQVRAFPDGPTVRVLDPEVALVHFLVHLNKDAFPQLLGYADIARILATEDLDWSFIERFVRDEGFDVLAACSLAEVTGALGIVAPALPAGGGLRTRAWHAVWPERVLLLGGTGTDRSRRQEVVPFLVRHRLGAALRAAWRVVVPPPKAVAVWYADLPGPYPWRLLRGRARTVRGRRRALRARGDRGRTLEPAGPRDPVTTARLLRTRAHAEPLWLDVSGRSMGWSIPGGGRVRVDPVSAEPRPGEVWAFCDPQGEIVVHRHRTTVGGAHRFQGDARVRADEPVEPDRLIGRVGAVDPPRPPLRWGPVAGAIQREPRMVVARTVRLTRRLRSGDRVSEVEAAAVLAGVVVDVGGVAIGLGAADSTRAEAVASLFRHARIVPDTPAATLEFDAAEVAAPAAEPDKVLDHVDLWWTGPGELVVRSDEGLTARCSADTVVVSGDAPGLAREFRFVALIALTHVLARRGRHLLHGAALVVDDAALLVVGGTGTGKSTLAFAAHRLGWSVLADDAVLLERRDTHVFARGLPRPIAVAADVVAEAIEGGRGVPDDPRRRVELPAGTLAAGEHPVVGVAVTTGGDAQGPAIVPLRGTDTLRELLRASIALVDADVRPALFALCGDLARLPAWSLRHGADATVAVEDATRRLEDLRSRLATRS